MVRSFLFRLMNKRLLAVLLPALLAMLALGCTACEGPLASTKTESHFRLASWNLQTLFDGQETGTEYDDYTADASWDEIAYKSRLQSLTEDISRWPEPQTRGESAGPDVIALLEIENAAVLQDLLSGPFARFKYRYSAFATNPDSPLGLGLLSRFPIARTRSHSLQTESFSTPRPMLEAELSLPGDQLLLFVCHWKSKLGNLEETEAIRRASAQLVNRRISELQQERPNDRPLVLVVGDLNENIDEFERQGGTVLTALMPAGTMITSYPEGAAESPPCIFLTASAAELTHAAEGPAVMYSPWYDAAWQGSYVYQGAWETIDHILIAPAFFDGSGWEYAGFSVLDQAPFINDSGYPNSFNPRTGKGLSDHLPIVADFYQNPR